MKRLSFFKGRLFIFLVYTLLLGVYIFMFFRSGYQMASDSGGYVEGISTRKVLYPLFLLLFRQVFDESTALNLTALFQGLFGFSCVVYFAEYWRKKFSFFVFSVIAVLINYVEFFVLFNFAWVSNSILTEGLWWPLSLVWFVLIQKVCTEEWRLYRIVALFFVETILILIKSQLIVFTICGLIILGYKCFQHKKHKELLIKVFFSVLTILSLILGGVIYRNTFVKANSNQINHYDYNLVANVFFSAKADDAELMNGDERKLFLELFNQCQTEQYVYTSIKEGQSQLELAYYRSANYDRVSFGVIKDCLSKWETKISEEQGISLDEAGTKLRTILTSIERKLFIANFGQFVYLYFFRVVESIIRSVFIDLSYIRVIGIVAYLMLVVAMFINKDNVELFTASLTITVLILINSMAVSVVIYPGYRYVAFVLGPFISLTLEHLYSFAKKKG